MSHVKGPDLSRLFTLAFARGIPNAKRKQGLALWASQETRKIPLILQAVTVQSLIVLCLSEGFCGRAV